SVHRVVARVDITMQRSRIQKTSGVRVGADETARGEIVVTGPLVIEAQIGVEVLAGEEIGVSRGARLGQRLPEGIVSVARSDGTGDVREEPSTPQSIEDIEELRACLSLGNEAQSIYVTRIHGSVWGVFFKHVAGWRIRIDRI